MDPKAASLNVELLPISKLKEATYNPRQISGEAFERLSTSMGTFGLVDPIVVNKRTGYTVVGGHQRLKVLRERGIQEVSCVILDIEEDREKMLNIALNNQKMAGEFDFAKMADLLLEFDQKGLDATLTGFSDDELEKILSWTPEGEETDEPPMVPLEETTISRRGDLWELGGHRVLCGDATSREDHALLSAGQPPAQVVFTDPPYGVAYEGAAGTIKGDAEAGDALLNLVRGALQQLLGRTVATAAWYVWHASATREDFATALKELGLMERQYIVWAKPSFVLGHADYHWAHEPCFYAARAGEKPDWYGDRAQQTVWRVAQKTEGPRAAALGPGVLLVDGHGNKLWITKAPPKGKKARSFRVPLGQAIELHDGAGTGTTWEVARSGASQHPTQKPAELAAIALQNSSRIGDVVVDPFLGGGCTLLGAEKTGRRCLGMDLDPRWVDLVVRRWQAMTNRRARNLTRPETVIA